eukprot:CAMPEP_0113714616 /NCGR_PEP_ID=MMETSP0038_2-20120614/32727_1 /TAXON_ID=2898 /ORGANISM="Cryptomonas paramecium" /LENGTH=71 /DNA_ID=CAMNT_0000641635 /DNA_START=65 /DNA_END=276 /DNA_ORIENTATION=+ /assembly_acc=CAM_ASM_000170
MSLKERWMEMKETVQDEARTVKELTAVLSSFKEPPSASSAFRPRAAGMSNIEGKENFEDDPMVWQPPTDSR